MSSAETFAGEVEFVLSGIQVMLEEKNRKYGDAALNPSRIFSRADTAEQIRVRIDDKLNRLKNRQSDEDEDVVKDLIGYLVILTIAQYRENGYPAEDEAVFVPVRRIGTETVATENIQRM